MLFFMQMLQPLFVWVGRGWSFNKMMESRGRHQRQTPLFVIAVQGHRKWFIFAFIYPQSVWLWQVAEPPNTLCKCHK